MGVASDAIPMPAGSAMSIPTLRTVSMVERVAFLFLTTHAAARAGNALTPSWMVMVGTRFLKSRAEP